MALLADFESMGCGARKERGLREDGEWGDILIKYLYILCNIN